MDITLLACPECKAVFVPPKYACSNCQNNDLHEKQMSGSGTIYSHTTIHIGPEKFASEAPYHIVLIELEEGQRITARLTEGEPVIGQKVALQRMEDDVYWFAPAP